MSVDSSTLFTFGTEDYVLFILMLLLSAGIGVYIGFFGKQSNTTKEYLSGGNRLKTIPVGISLVASQLSAIAFIAIPAELYNFGITDAFSTWGVLLSLPISCWITTPIFYNNKISNCYEYLEMRFDRRTRHAMTAIFVLTVCLSLPVYMFVPSLAFAQVTGNVINFHLINGVVCFICVFYTMLGGIKAVVWTDVIQGVIMLGSVVLVAALAVSRTGGLKNVLQYAYEGGRLQLNTNFDLTTRTTVWNTFIGSVFMWTSYVAFNQSCIQRIVALPSVRHAKSALMIFAFGSVVIGTINHFLGIVLFAAYHDCDPVKAGLVTQADKLMMFFIQDVIGHLWGIPGLFVSALFSASLSTMSAFLNSLSGIVYFDYVKPFISHTERRANLIMKALVFCAGVYSFLGGVVIGNFKSVIQMMLTILGLTHGAILGTFILGMFVPRAHGSAGFYGMIFSLAVMIWIVVGAKFKFSSIEFNYLPLPTRVDGCDAYNITVVDPRTLTPSANNRTGFSIFAISYHWYKPIGAVCVWIMAIPLSYLIPRNNSTRLEPKLLVPFVRRFIPPEHRVPEVPEEVPLNNP